MFTLDRYMDDRVPSRIVPFSFMVLCIATLVTALVAATNAAFCCQTAYADDAVAVSYDESGNATSYNSIDDAMRGGYKTGATVVMMKDWSLDSTLEIEKGKSITIDMNGHSINGNGHEVIYLCEKSNLTLTSTVSKAFGYTGYSNQDGSEVESGLNSGGLITGGCTGDPAGGIDMRSNSTLTLDNVAVAGNRSTAKDSGDASAGGIFTYDGCNINMKNGAIIVGNTAKTGGIFFNGENCNLSMNGSYINANYAIDCGGGIYSDGDGTRIKMENGSKISSNTAVNKGGGVYFNYSYFNIVSKDKTAEISENTAKDDDGGGVFVQYKRWATNEGSIEGCTISQNSCRLNGGGILCYQNWTRIIDCTITGNHSGKEGGGVYVLGSNDSIEGCTITGNWCADDSEGGGVFVYYKEDIKLKGTCIIKDNTRGKSGSADDLFLMEGTTDAYITNGVDVGSKVGIRTGTTGDRRIGKNISNYAYGAYFIDLDGYYVSHGTDEGGDLWQRRSTQQFLVQVDGEGTNRFAYKATAVANGASSDAGKAFWYWDEDGTTGLYPVTDFITNKSKYSSTFTFSMPQNDVNLKAVYADKVTSGIMCLEQPVAGQELPRTVSFARNDGGSGWNNELMNIPVTWYEVDSNGVKTVASGTAKYGKTYVASASVSQSQTVGRFFSGDIAGRDVIVRLNAEEGTTDTRAASATVDDTGALIIETNQFAMPSPEIESISEVSLTVNGGIKKSQLLSLLPDSATVSVNDGTTKLLATDKNKAITWPSNLFDADDRVVQPASSGAGYKIQLPLADTDEVASVAGEYLTINLKVLDENAVAEPELSPVGGTYDKYSGSAKLDDDLRLKVEATCPTEGATIMYKLDSSADAKVYEYDPDAGIVLTGTKDEQEICEIVVWAEKTIVDPETNKERTARSNEYQSIYVLDDTLNKTIGIACSDTGYYQEGEQHWTSSFDVTADTHAHVALTAPVQQGRVFDHWEWRDKPDNETADLTQQTIEIKDFSPDYAGKITAVYAPVVSKLDVGISQPTAHIALDKAATSIKVVTADSQAERDITGYFADNAAIVWSPSGDAEGNAEHLRRYTAALSLDPAVSSSDSKYVLSSGLQLMVNGVDVSGSAYVNDNGETTMLYIEFPQTDVYVYSSLAQPEDVSLSFDEAVGYQAGQDLGKEESWGLPREVQVRFKCGESLFADIEWGEVTGFDKTKLEAQELSVTGTIKYPGVVDDAGAPETVTVKIKIDSPAKVDAPVASPGSGTYEETQSVKLSCATEGAVIRYTTDGSEPVEDSLEYTGAIEVGSTTTIKACAFRDGMAKSDVATFDYEIEADKVPADTVAKPTASVEPGQYKQKQSVKLSCATEGAVIRYTTDGGEPTEESSEYADAIEVDSFTMIEARAYHDGMTQSDIAFFAYSIEEEPEVAATCIVTFDSAGGSVVEAQSIEQGGKVQKPADPVRDGYVFGGWYLNDAEYDFGTQVDKNMVLTAHWDKAEGPSRAATPVASVESGIYLKAQQVEFSCDTGGAVIRYTTDGTDPTPESAFYDGALQIDSFAIVKARAFRDGMEASDIALYAYAVTAAQASSHQVTFVSSGGSAVASQVVFDGNAAVSPASPKRKGYSFAGWYLSGGDKYDFATPVTGDLTLYAHWSASDDAQWNMPDDTHQNTPDDTQQSTSGGVRQGTSDGAQPAASSEAVDSSSLSATDRDSMTPTTGDSTLLPIVAGAAMASFALFASATCAVVLRQQHR